MRIAGARTTFVFGPCCGSKNGPIEAGGRGDYNVHFDDRCTAEISVAPLGPGEKRPAKAIANIAIARIEPKTAFALSHLSYSR
jgi:hypothetical protein